MNDGNYWMPGNGLVSRRSLLRAVGVASTGLAAAALVGCSGESKPAATGTAAAGGTGAAAAGAYIQPTSGWDKFTLDQYRDIYSGNRLKDLPTQKLGPKYGGRVRFSSLLPLASWDPTGAGAGSLPVAMFAHNGLLQFRADDFVPDTFQPQFSPVLAQAMPEQPDPLTYIFKLNQGVKFQNLPPVNGRELTAEDVAYVFNTYRQTPIQSGTLAAVTAVNAVDKYTVQFKLSEPAAYFIAQTAAPLYWIFSPEQHKSADGLGKTPIGTGAWILDRLDPAGNYSFKKNPDYFRKDPRTGKQLPYLDGVDGIKYQSLATQIAAFRANDLDVVWPGDFKTWVSVMESKPDSVTQVISPPPIAQTHIALRLDKAPFSDVRVRRALSMLIDRDSIIQNILFGMGGYSYGQDWSYFDQKWIWAPDQLGPWIKYNVPEAKKLLAAAGLDKNFTVELFSGLGSAGTRFNIAAAATAMWEAAGIKVNITVPPDSASSNKVAYGGTYPGALSFVNFPPGADPDAYTYITMYSKAPLNIYHINDPKIDQWCLDQRHAVNKADRQKILKDLMNYDLDQMTRIWLLEPYKINLRQPTIFNVTDMIDYWCAPAWATCNTDVTWRSA